MQHFFNSQDSAKLEAAEEARFIDQCRDEFIEKSLADSNRRKVQQLTLISYLPNLVSAVTAGFFVLYLLSGYTRTVAWLLGFLLIVIVVAIEAGKRGLIGSIGKDYFTLGKVPALAVAALAACFVLSMGASYMGGKQLVIATAPPPEREHNPQIDSLNRLLADQQATVDRLQRTTWKGKVTSDAVKGINRAKSLQASIYDRIATLEAQDDAAHAQVLATHTEKHLNFGYILGILAALADIFLLGLIWTAKRLKYEIAAVHFQPMTATATAPAIGSYHHFQNPTLNQHQPQQHPQPAPVTRRPIGFVIHSDGNDPEPDHHVNENRNNENRITEGNRICENCGIAYRYRHQKQKYCSDQCRIDAWQSRTGKALKKAKKV